MTSRLVDLSVSGSLGALLGLISWREGEKTRESGTLKIKKKKVPEDFQFISHIRIWGTAGAECQKWKVHSINGKNLDSD